MKNGHLQTIIPALFRQVSDLHFERERIDTPDDDFLDLDWSKVAGEKIIVLCHGLEGSSDTSYIKATAQYFNSKGWDALAWNYRGCSGEMNKQLRFYHSGETGDLDTVLKHIFSKNQYKEILLCGFSLGGNIALKYLGEQAEKIDKRIIAAAAISAPLDLQAAAIQLEKRINQIYLSRFLKTLKQKIRLKAESFPKDFSVENIDELKSFHTFDDRYTAPLHGFADAREYYRLCSAKPLLKRISVPTLILSPKNDPFLPPACYPVQEAKESPNIYLEIPDTGGHLGFMQGMQFLPYWPARRMLEFVKGN